MNNTISYTPTRHQNISRFLSYVLRHKPEKIKLNLDPEGWGSIEDLLINSRTECPGLNLKTLMEIVAEDEKGRYSLSTDGLKIRAAQGHSSTQVNIKHKVMIPPLVLFHGTSNSFKSSILEQGLQKQSRHHVHLSSELETAFLVGKRRDKNPVIFKIDTAKMLVDGFEFFVSENSVWLVDQVPAKYIYE